MTTPLATPALLPCRNMRRLHDSRPPAFAGCLAWLQQEVGACATRQAKEQP